MTTKGRSKIIRRRVIKSCQYCYAHKLKCNRESPCLTCQQQGTQDQCVYNFQDNDTLTHRKSLEQFKVLKEPRYTLRSSTQYKLFKPKTFYPFFSSSLTDKLVFSSIYDDVALTPNFTRNPITRLNKLDKQNLPDSIDDVISILPKSLEEALSQLDIFQSSIHAIIPVLSISESRQAITNFYEDLSSSQINTTDALVLLGILFCSSYSAIASGIVIDTDICTNYYNGYRFLLHHSDFPRYPTIEALQVFTVVNFVIDPNMLDMTGHSAMLIRVAQQLGLHKNDQYRGDKTNQRLNFLWNYLLYIDGSTSVVHGFPFSTRTWLYQQIVIDLKYRDPDLAVPVEFSLGRFCINKVFRSVMDMSIDEETIGDRLRLQKEISELCSVLIRLSKDLESRLGRIKAQYFNSTLFIFLFRLHSRFILLTSGQLPQDKILESQNTDNKKVEYSINNITWILDKPQKFDVKVTTLSLLILIQTLRRITQDSIDKYLWYTKGSTVMQYLFVLLKDLYQHPSSDLHIEDVFPEYGTVVGEEILNSYSNNPNVFKIVLLDILIGVLELKLAPLWSNSDLFQFTLVKSLKEAVEVKFSDFIDANDAKIHLLKESVDLFRLAEKCLVNKSSICLEDCLRIWENDDEFLQYTKSFAEWLTEL